MFHWIKTPNPCPLKGNLISNNLLLTIQYLFLSERTPLESFNSMYLTAVLLLSFCCDAPFNLVNYIEKMRRSLPGTLQRVELLSNTISFRQTLFVSHFFHDLIKEIFLDCFGLPSTNKKYFSYIRANLAMTTTLRDKEALQNRGVFVIARPTNVYITSFSSVRPKQSEIITL